MAKAEKTPGTKVITIAESDLNKAIAELVKDGHVGGNMTELVEKGFVKAELDEVGVDADKFLGDYVRFSVGPNAKTDKQILAALVAISGGNLTQPVKDDGEEDSRKPSLVKFALYGADLAARSRTTNRIKAVSEGPEKAIEKMADQIQKAKPGKFTREQAVEMAKMLLADDEPEQGEGEQASA